MDGVARASSTSAHVEDQRQFFDGRFAEGPREHIRSPDPLVRYLVEGRLRRAMGALADGVGRDLTGASVLVLCAGEGGEGACLLDMGFRDVTISDLTQAGVDAGLGLDPRLKGLALDAQATGLEDGAYDIVVVQDGLHHLPNPVAGFVEMLRLSRIGAVFIEPHRSLVGRSIGRDWEVNGTAENYVFRWSRWLVESVASSYLGRDRFRNLSYSHWHHNLALLKLGERVGGGSRGLAVVRGAKAVADRMAAPAGNMFCGIIVHRPARA